MRFPGQVTVSKSEAPPIEASTEAQEQRHVRILIETAMEHAQYADADTELTARQLAGELNKIGAALSDVRVTVQALYQGDRQAAQTYLDYLAKHGFPHADESTTTPQTPITQKQAVPIRSLEDQNQAIAQQPIAYGQVASSSHESATNSIALYGGNLIAELVANSA